MMLNNLKVDRTVQTKETAQPIDNQKIEDTTITGNATTDSSIVDNIPMVKGMNPILKYSIMGIGGALVIFLGYRMIFKRK